MKDLEIGLCWGTLHRASLTELIEAAARYRFPTLSFPPYLYAAGLEQGLAESLRLRLSHV